MTETLSCSRLFLSHLSSGCNIWDADNRHQQRSWKQIATTKTSTTQIFIHGVVGGSEPKRKKKKIHVVSIHDKTAEKMADERWQKWNASRKKLPQLHSRYYESIENRLSEGAHAVEERTSTAGWRWTARHERVKPWSRIGVSSQLRRAL